MLLSKRIQCSSASLQWLVERSSDDDGGDDGALVLPDIILLMIDKRSSVCFCVGSCWG